MESLIVSSPFFPFASVAWLCRANAIFLIKHLSESVQSLFREPASVRNPIGERSETRGLYTTRTHASNLFASDESTCFQNLNVLDNRSQRHVERHRQGTSGRRTLAQPFDDGPARWFRERSEAAIDSRMVKHKLEYIDPGLNCQAITKVSILATAIGEAALHCTAASSIRSGFLTKNVLKPRCDRELIPAWLATSRKA